MPCLCSNENQSGDPFGRNGCYLYRARPPDRTTNDNQPIILRQFQCCGGPFSIVSPNAAHYFLGVPYETQNENIS
jgi:hypothetical protein